MLRIAARCTPIWAMNATSANARAMTMAAIAESPRAAVQALSWPGVSGFEQSTRMFWSGLVPMLCRT